MKAFQFVNVDEGLQLRDLPIPEPAKGHALVKVKAAGLCRSDTHVLHGGGAGWMCALPVTLGHEIAGTIVKFGQESLKSSFQVDDRVAVACVGHPIQDRNFQEAPGNLVKLPGNVDFAEAAVATDSVATAYHAVVTEGGIDEWSTVAIIGLGGLGLNGVAIAAVRGAKVYGVDVNTAKFDQAQAAGAIKCSTSMTNFSDVAFDVVVDFAGAQPTLDAAMSQVRDGGTVVLVGLAASNLSFSTSDLVTRNISLKGSTSASMSELGEVLKLLESGALKPHIQAIPFEQVPEGLEALGRNEVQGRLYTIP